jgi:diacylglycerol kinase (ATP)
MNGRFYGGGMMPTPNQNRLDPRHTVSTLVLFGAGKLKTLAVFPSIFKGEHIKHTQMAEVLTGHDITVEFDRPTAIQIDGETILGVSGYHVSSAIRLRISSASCANQDQAVCFANSLEI